MNKPLPSTENSLPIALLRAREAVMVPIRPMLAASGLTEQQWRVLRVLEETGGTDARALAEGAAISPPSLSRILSGLEDRRLIMRTNDTKDRRRQVVGITSAGISIIDANRKAAKQRAQEARDRLGPEKFDTLLSLLGEVSRWTDTR